MRTRKRRKLPAAAGVHSIEPVAREHAQVNVTNCQDLDQDNRHHAATCPKCANHIYLDSINYIFHYQKSRSRRPLSFYYKITSKKILFTLIANLLLLCILESTLPILKPISCLQRHPSYLQNSQTKSSPQDEKSKSNVLFDIIHNHGGIIKDRNITLTKITNPILINTDIIIRKNAKLTIEPGTEILFDRGRGFIVQGTLNIQGTENDKVKLGLLKSSESATLKFRSQNARPSGQHLVRLVDGDLPSEGRVQIKFNDRWHSLCTNSKNLTALDIKILCQQAGYNSGHWYKWFPHRNITTNIPQMMSKSFHCSGSEESITQCKRWNRIRIGGGICDSHSDIGLNCSRKLIFSEPASATYDFWRGIEYFNSETTYDYFLDGQMRQKISRSSLRHVTISDAGLNEVGNATAAVRVYGQAPQMSNIEIKNSIYGIMIEDADDAIHFDNIYLHNNMAHSIFVNTSWGKVIMDNVRVENNGGDGIRIVRHERVSVGPYDFCKFANLGTSQTFPVSLSHEQTFFTSGRECCQEFISNDLQLTVHFPVLRSTPNNLLPESDPNRRVSIPPGITIGNDAHLLIYDDYREEYPFKLRIANHTRAQSIVSKSGRLKICYEPAHYRTVLFTIDVVADQYDDWSGRARDFEISNSLIQNNEGRGVWIDNQRSGSKFYNTSIMNHNYMSGIHIENGTGEFIVQGCKISNNTGHGIFLDMAGGYYHIDNSSITDNTLKGILLEYDKRPELIAFNQTFHLGYSLVAHNGENGLYIGNVCRSDASWNISMSSFVKNQEDAISFQSCLPTDENVDSFKAHLPRWNLHERATNDYQELYITHNTFYSNLRRAIHIKPVMFLKALVRHNMFREHPLAVILISNTESRDQDSNIGAPVLTYANIRVAMNRFHSNKGRYVANLGVQENNPKQVLVFTKNILEDNYIHEPTDAFKSRSRVSAVVVVSSSNTRIVRNRFDNPKSEIELGSHLEVYNKVINASTNYWGPKLDAASIYRRIFDFKNRYNLAQVEFLPYLMSPDDLEYATDLSLDRERDKITSFRNGRMLGGEVKSYDELEPGDYVVENDIFIRPRSHLIIKKGVTLRFHDGVGMMVQGRLDTLGHANSQILFTSLNSSRISKTNLGPSSALSQAKPKISNNNSFPLDNDRNTEFEYDMSSQPHGATQNVRLSHGSMGRLEVQIEGAWGSVCDYNFDIDDASVVCQQLGMTLNKNDWLLEKFQYAANDNQQLTMISTNVLMTNLRCDPTIDTDLTRCKSEISLRGDFDGLCNSEVGVRCFSTSWAGVRLGMGAETSIFENLVIQRAGMYDSASNTLKPALQIDLNRHLLNSVVIRSNSDSGLGIMWNDVIGKHFHELSIIDSKFTNNERHGITLRSKGLNIKGSIISGNRQSGLDYKPSFSQSELSELLSWLNNGDNLDRVFTFSFPMKQRHYTVPSFEESFRFFIFPRLPPANINESFTISTDPGHMLSVHLLNPIHPESTEVLNMSTGVNAESPMWDLRMNMTSFPMVSPSFRFHLNYTTGDKPVGSIVLYVRSRYNNRDFRLLTRNLPAHLVMPKFEQTALNINSRLINSLIVTNSNITKNGIGMRLRHPNYFFGQQKAYNIRYANETTNITGCLFDGNYFSSITIGGEDYEINSDTSNKTIPTSEIHYNLIGNKFQRNKDGLRQFSRDLRKSHNVFHWTLNDTSFLGNKGGGINIVFPYYWRYDANLTHSFHISNNTFMRNNQFELVVNGHFVVLDLIKNVFKDNRCKSELLSINGMEKQMLIRDNVIEQNSCSRLIKINVNSHADKFGKVPAEFLYNSLRFNRRASSNATLNLATNSGNQRGLKLMVPLHPLTIDYALSLAGLQPINVTRNLFFNPELRYELVAAVVMNSIYEDTINATENYWGSVIKSDIVNRIFDFDDWNSYAIIIISPFLTTDSFTAASMRLDTSSAINHWMKPLGGRLTTSMTLPYRKDPYVVESDLTVMPNATLFIERGVTLEFMPSVGILVLGDLIAAGSRDRPIIMKPFFSSNDLYPLKNYLVPLKDPPNILHANLSDQSSFDYIYTMKQHQLAYPIDLGSIRLCKNEICNDGSHIYDNNVEEPTLRQEAIKSISNTWKMDGFLEVFNMTTLQWVPICDPLFNEFSARVACRKLGYSHLAIHKRGRRYTIEQEQISSVKSWFEPVQCEGDESSLSHCPLAPSGFVNYSSSCTKEGNQFLYLYCQDFPEMAASVVPSQDHGLTNDHVNHWGGLRFACPSSAMKLEPDSQELPYTIVDARVSRFTSTLQYVSIDRAGISHSRRAPAVQVSQCPINLEFVAITNSAHHGLDIVSSQASQLMHQLRIRNNLGIGFNYVSLTGSSSASRLVPYLPLKHLELSGDIYGLVDICGAQKDIEIQERLLLYYRYDSQPRDCIKIVSSNLHIKKIGIRMLSFDLFNFTSHIARPDSLRIYDGSIFDWDSQLIADLGVTDRHRHEKPELKFYQTTDSTMTIRMHASAASSYHGFIAEVITTPVSYTIRRDTYNNITFSDIVNNKLGAIHVNSAGESTPNFILRSNRIDSNCMHLFGNFTSCMSPINMVLQNCQRLNIRDNLIRANQGGVTVRAYSQTAVSALEAIIENNVFESNNNTSTLALLGPKTDPYQTAKISQNIFSRNYAPYLSNIMLSRFFSNFSYNQMIDNTGKHQIEVLGFEKLPFSYQTIESNWIYNNKATFERDRSTIYGTSAGQTYRQNYIVNPDNSFEISTMNWSRYDVKPFHVARDDEIIHLASGDGSSKDIIRKTVDAIPINILDTKKVDLFHANIDAKLNWWGFNATTSIQGRVRDRAQHEELIKVDFLPFLETNTSLLSGICAGGWQKVGDACLIYVGARMTYQEAKDFCDREKATLPLLRGNHYEFSDFIRSRARGYDSKIDRIWVRSFEVSRDACPTLNDYRTRNYDCQDRYSFLCEKDPQVIVSLLHWHRETDGLIAIILALVTMILVVLCSTCWAYKSRHRHKEKMIRKNTIYASMRSNRNPYTSSTAINEGFSNRTPYSAEKSSIGDLSLSSQASGNNERQGPTAVRYNPNYSSQDMLSRNGNFNNHLGSFSKPRRVTKQQVAEPLAREKPMFKSPIVPTTFNGETFNTSSGHLPQLYRRVPSSTGSQTGSNLSECLTEPLPNFNTNYGHILGPAIRRSSLDSQQQQQQYQPADIYNHNQSFDIIGRVHEPLRRDSNDIMQANSLGNRDSILSVPTYYSNTNELYRRSIESRLETYQADYNDESGQRVSNERISYVVTDKSSISDLTNSTQVARPIVPVGLVNMNPQGVAESGAEFRGKYHNRPASGGSLAADQTRSNTETQIGPSSSSINHLNNISQNQNRYCVETSFDFETPTMAPAFTFSSSQRLSPVSSYEAHTDSNLGSRVYLETSFE